MRQQADRVAEFGWPKPRPQKTLLAQVKSLARREPLGVPALAVVVLLILFAALAPIIAPYDPYSYIAEDQLVGLSWRHLMGTDQYGRDVFSRIVYGARLSLIVGFTSVTLAVGTGTTIGLLSGYWAGSAVDHLSQRLVDSLMAIPGLVLAIAIMAIVGIGIPQVIIAIAIVVMPTSARVVRGAVISVKENQYVEAARSAGAGDARILRLHVLPNVFAPIIVIMSLEVGGAITIEASLSFLGYGAPPAEPSWGGMLSRGARSYIESAPWLAVFPGLALSSVVVGLNVFGDALRDLLDPRLRR